MGGSRAQVAAVDVVPRAAADEARAMRAAVERVRVWIVVAAVALSPVSVAFKFVYDLPFTWVDPSLLLGAVAALLPPWPRLPQDRAVRRLLAAGVAFVAAHWVSAAWASTVRAVGEVDYFREPIRTTLCLLLAVAVSRAAPQRGAMRAMLRALAAATVIDVAWAVYILAAVGLNLPLPGAWRAYTTTYIFRQSLFVGALIIPRLGGTFVEAPPFGLYVLAVGLVFAAVRELQARWRIWLPRRWVDATVWFAVLGSASSQILGALGVGVAFVARLARTATAGQRVARQLLGLVVVGVCVALVVPRLQSTGADTGPRGSSVGERTDHLERAGRLFATHPLVGVGPGLFGEYTARETNWYYPPTTTPQVIFAEIPAELGIVGVVTLAGLVAALAAVLPASRSRWAAASVPSLFLAAAFQSSWRAAILFIVWPILIVLARRDPPARPRPTGAQRPTDSASASS